MTVSLSQDERAAMQEAVARALREDLGPDMRDVTSGVIPAHVQVRAELVSRSGGVIAGLPVAQAVFGALDEEIEVDLRLRDSHMTSSGDVLAVISGSAASVLACERVALNFMQRMSGVATLTRRYVAAVAGTGARICDTRKTTPGLRALERYAVRCGGGLNHRFGLFDAIMIKDNHVDSWGMADVAAQARSSAPSLPLIVEVRTHDELEQALTLEPEIVLLDNMDLHMVRRCVATVAGRCEIEASGGVTLENAPALASAGVDRISIGALTHSAPALDIALDVTVSA